MTIAEFLTQEVREELQEELRREKEQSRKEKESIAHKLHNKGVDLMTIHECTNIPMDELERLLRRKAS